MNKIVLFEDAGFANLLPLTYWRTVFGLRCGRKTLSDRLAQYLGRPAGGLWTRDWLAAVAAERYMVPVNAPADENTVLVNSRWLIDRAVEFKPGPFAGTSGDQIVYLTALDAGKRMYARTLPSYSFTAGAGGAQRHFQLAVEPKGADNLVITSASAQSSGVGVVVTYSVSRPCEVNVVVLNIAGRKIRSLATASPATAGSNVQIWNLRRDDGTLAPSGQYLVRIEAATDERPCRVAQAGHPHDGVKPITKLRPHLSRCSPSAPALTLTLIRAIAGYTLAMSQRRFAGRYPTRPALTCFSHRLLPP